MQHFVFSALEDTHAALEGKVPEVTPGRIVPHFESKAEITVRGLAESCHKGVRGRLLVYCLQCGS